MGNTTGQGYLLGRPGNNLGLGAVDIEALSAGTLIVDAAPAAPATAPNVPSAMTAPPPPPEKGRPVVGDDALESSPV